MSLEKSGLSGEGSGAVDIFLQACSFVFTKRNSIIRIVPQLAYTRLTRSPD
ncbi:hypothetical protein WH47_01616 [Habropoda laboriosa]|uniref:Uncharacterized protein n=1 Tax=Habropoda laboriosa TaxID=597456 RepID=A0A0L7R0S8_9HYME|nr:hypothetical protein WH47_01616 [Habropoda laboriosa]